MNSKFDIKTLESWLWEAACKIRGDVDAPKYKDYILPLIFLKRLSDVFDDEIERLATEYGNKAVVEDLLKKDHSLVRFYLPPKARWGEITKQTAGVGEFLTDAVRSIARENKKLEGVIDSVDFNATAQGQRLLSDDKLKLLIEVLGQHRLGKNDVEPDLIGRAYEYLLRKFAEGSGSSAGEFYTPLEVTVLMSHILDPEPDDKIYDPCCGSGGLLIKCYSRFKEKFGDDPKKAPPSFYGQELLHTTAAMAKMNMFIHDMEANIVLGDTMNKPAFLEKNGSLAHFNLVTANPMWNQDFVQSVYENDAYNRFGFGYPPSSSADWGWLQHMFASLEDNGKMAVVLDTGAVSRGSGNQGANKERDIRKEFVDKNLIEVVILLPENLFYNTTAAGIIIIINKNKRKKGEILLINAGKLFTKGRPKNYLSDESIAKIARVYSDWKAEDSLSAIITKETAIQTDYNLSPSRYVRTEEEEEVLPLDEAVVELKEAEEERRAADKELEAVLRKLGL